MVEFHNLTTEYLMNHNKRRYTPNSICQGMFLSIVLLLTLPIFSLAEDDGNDNGNKTIIAASDSANDALSNSLPALVLAAGSDVDYVAFDVVATRDNQLIVYHDIDLEPGTDVADKFPEHARKDGRFLSMDFTLDEIRLLRRKQSSDFADPTNISLGIATFSEYLALARHLEKQFNNKIGLAPNLIHPGFHLDEGIDISSLCLQRLVQFGYNQVESGLLLQSMDADELQRIKKELLPRLTFEVPLIQRIGNQPSTAETDKQPLQRYDQTWMFTRLGARMISSYGSGIIIDTSMIHDPSGAPLNTVFMENIRALAIPVYGFLTEIPESLPAFTENREALYDFYLTTLGLDGISTSSYKEISLYLKTKEESARKLKLPIFPLKPIP